MFLGEVISGASSRKLFRDLGFAHVVVFALSFFFLPKMIDTKKESDLEGLEKTSTTSHPNDGQHNAVQAHDDVFGEITEHGPNYRNVRFIFPVWFLVLLLCCRTRKQKKKKKRKIQLSTI